MFVCVVRVVTVVERESCDESFVGVDVRDEFERCVFLVGVLTTELI